jgi:hypothetical protein
MKILNNASDRLPYFAFYPADWISDISLRLCSAETRGVWIDLLCYMSLSPDRGYLIVSDRVLDKKGIQKLAGITPKRFKKIFEELTEFGILKQDEKGRFYSKRMVGDERLRQIRREVGKKGGNPNLKKKKEDLFRNLDNQKENQKSTVSESESKSYKNNTIVLYDSLNPLIDYIQKNCPNIQKLSKALSEDQAEKILQEFNFEEIRDTLDRMENYKPLLKKYSSVNLTLKNWLKNANHDKSNNKGTNGKPSFDDAIRNF